MANVIKNKRKSDREAIRIVSQLYGVSSDCILINGYAISIHSDSKITGDIYTLDIITPYFIQLLEGSFFITRPVLNNLKGAPMKVTEDFGCVEGSLGSLKGCPKVVGKSFDCRDNSLRSLQYGPTSVGSFYNCSGNKLQSLKGSPKRVSGYFDCSSNNLMNLEGSPEYVGGIFYCDDNGNPFTLIGAPQYLGMDLVYSNVSKDEFENYGGNIEGSFRDKFSDRMVGNG